MLIASFSLGKATFHRREEEPMVGTTYVAQNRVANYRQSNEEDARRIAVPDNDPLPIFKRNPVAEKAIRKLRMSLVRIEGVIPVRYELSYISLTTLEPQRVTIEGKDLDAFASVRRLISCEGTARLPESLGKKWASILDILRADETVQKADALESPMAIVANYILENCVSGSIPAFDAFNRPVAPVGLPEDSRAFCFEGEGNKITCFWVRSQHIEEALAGYVEGFSRGLLWRVFRFCGIRSERTPSEHRRRMSKIPPSAWKRLCELVGVDYPMALRGTDAWSETPAASDALAD